MTAAQAKAKGLPDPALFLGPIPIPIVFEGRESSEEGLGVKSPEGVTIERLGMEFDMTCEVQFTSE